MSKKIDKILRDWGSYCREPLSGRSGSPSFFGGGLALVGEPSTVKRRMSRRERIDHKVKVASVSGGLTARGSQTAKKSTAHVPLVSADVEKVCKLVPDLEEDERNFLKVWYVDHAFASRDDRLRELRAYGMDFSSASASRFLGKLQRYIDRYIQNYDELTSIRVGQVP